MRKAFIIMLFFMGCDPTWVPPQPTPVATDTDFCNLAAVHIEKLHCDEAKPTKKGKSFTDFCIEMQAKGVFLNPKCLASVENCSEIDSCTHSQ